MSHVSLVGVVLRVSLLLALALGVLPFLRGSSASLRRWLVSLGVCASLAVPLLALTFPGQSVVQVQTTTFVGHVVAEALSPSLAPNPLPDLPRASVQVAPRSLSASSWLLSIWAVGVLLVAARLFYGAVWAWRLRASAVSVQSAKPGVRISAAIEAPVVVGILRPIVLLPVASQAWTEERMNAVLLHEFSHVRRRDGLALFAAQLACALYWFQPLAWIARNRLRRECELAADESVIAAGLRPSSYAQHLLEIARGLVPVGGIAMAARPSELAASPIASSNKGVDARFQAIVDEESRRLHEQWNAERVAILILDPRTGTLLANADDAPGKPIVPASTMKPLVIATALDADLITPEQRFDCGNGSRSYGSLVLRDGGEYGTLDVGELLAVSSNVGVSRIFDVLGGERMGRPKTIRRRGARRNSQREHARRSHRHRSRQHHDATRVGLRVRRLRQRRSARKLGKHAR